MFDLDIVDYGNIPTLIAQVRKRLNTIEFLERLNVIARTAEGIKKMTSVPRREDVLFGFFERHLGEAGKMTTARIGLELQLADILSDVGSLEDQSFWYYPLQRLVETGNVWGSGRDWASCLETALVMLLRSARSRSGRAKLEAFLGILPAFKEDHLNMLALGNTPYTGKPETILAVMNALPRGSEDGKLMQFLVGRLEAIIVPEKPLESWVLLAFTRHSRSLAFQLSVAQHTRILAKLLSATLEEATRAQGEEIILAMLQQSDQIRQVVFDAGIFDMLLFDGSRSAQKFLSQVVEEAPTTV
ncbi:hypothetical protein GGX14DRAFT_53466 [Mycena pura]|uniref:Uncharacterized protein n=1 Tax=Mycena pura TaxID=153505 RepID=A0AAD6UM21_9AGAR|nr:hypothetical protein GGX14DRAFT_53466 [Mycena pura]